MSIVRHPLLIPALLVAAIILAGSSFFCANRVSAAKRTGSTGSTEQSVTPGEDLMHEHGVLRRVLLIYEEIDRRNRTNTPPLQALGSASGIIKHFIEDYHEKTEENYVFPRFEKAGKLVALVRTLKAQHDAGRKITTRIQAIAASKTIDQQSRHELSTLIHAFIRMYRPHAAREDTILFPALPEIVGAAEYKQLGETFEDREHKLFGAHGFESIVNKVATIEKSLGIYELSQFTPK